GSKFNIARAKRELLEFLPEGSGISVLNRDNDYFDYLSDYSSNHGSVITFGKHAKSDFRMSDILLNSLGFAKFKINEVPLEANSPGAHMPLNMACACATASALGIAFNEAIAGLATYKAPAMRLEIVLGKWETTIIDDTYNAAPDSVCSALATLQAIASTNRRSVAILGEIRELGDWSIEAHRVVGKCAGNTKLQVLIALGPATKPIVEELMSANPSAKISEFESTEAALLQLTNLIQPGDVILVKGSRALAMERIVAALKK
ncbi:MAG: Mur ligase family protein, partial [Chthonomonadales bacterium]